MPVLTRMLCSGPFCLCRYVIFEDNTDDCGKKEKGADECGEQGWAIPELKIFVVFISFVATKHSTILLACSNVLNDTPFARS